MGEVSEQIAEIANCTKPTCGTCRFWLRLRTPGDHPPSSFGFCDGRCEGFQFHTSYCPGYEAQPAPPNPLMHIKKTGHLRSKAAAPQKPGDGQ